MGSRDTQRARRSVGSGITPLLSIIATTLAQEPASSFTPVYGNQRVNTIMFVSTCQARPLMAELVISYDER